MQVDWDNYFSFAVIKKYCLIAFILIFSTLSWLDKNLFKISAVVIASLLLLGTVFHPWYALWFLPLLCFYPNKPLLYLSVSVLLAYQARLLGTNDVLPLVKCLEFLPILLLAWFARNPRKQLV